MGLRANISDKEKLKIMLSVPVEQQLNKEELARLHANIHFTHAFKNEESMAKMQEVVEQHNLKLPDFSKR